MVGIPSGGVKRARLTQNKEEDAAEELADAMLEAERKLTRVGPTVVPRHTQSVWPEG